MRSCYWFLVAGVSAASCALPSMDVVESLSNGGASGSGATAGGASGGRTATSGGNASAGTDTATGGDAGASIGGSVNGATGGASAGENAGGTSGSAGGPMGGTAGAPAAGGTAGATNGGGGTGGGAAGSPTGGGGAGGSPTKYCDGKVLATAPFIVSTAFFPSVWSGDVSAITILGPPTPAPCLAANRISGATGLCYGWTYTPPTSPTYAKISWSTRADANYTHPPVCLDTMTKVSFAARASTEGMALYVGAAGSAEHNFSLTTNWARYAFSVVGVQYNTDAIGLDEGFFWRLPATFVGTPSATFYIDDIQFQ